MAADPVRPAATPVPEAVMDKATEAARRSSAFLFYSQPASRSCAEAVIDAVKLDIIRAYFTAEEIGFLLAAEPMPRGVVRKLEALQ